MARDQHMAKRAGLDGRVAYAATDGPLFDRYFHTKVAAEFFYRIRPEFRRDGPATLWVTKNRPAVVVFWEARP